LIFSLFGKRERGESDGFGEVEEDIG